MTELDLPDDCWTTPIGDLSVGDVCEAVPFAVLCDDRIKQLQIVEESPWVGFALVRLSFGLVLGTMNGYAIVAVVVTQHGVDDEELFDELGESAREAREHIRLPTIPEDRSGAWVGREGVAMLSHLETFPIGYELLLRRVASMDEDAREMIRRRLARLLEP